MIHMKVALSEASTLGSELMLFLKLLYIKSAPPSAMYSADHLPTSLVNQHGPNQILPHRPLLASLTLATPAQIESDIATISTDVNALSSDISAFSNTSPSLLGALVRQLHSTFIIELTTKIGDSFRCCHT